MNNAGNSLCADVIEEVDHHEPPARIQPSEAESTTHALWVANVERNLGPDSTSRACESQQDAANDNMSDILLPSESERAQTAPAAAEVHQCLPYGSFYLVCGACRWRLAMGAVRFGLEGTAPSWSRTIGLVLKTATRTQGIMARKELPEERAQAKVDSRPQEILGACRWRLAMVQ